MAITVQEHYESGTLARAREGQGDSHELRYLVRGSDDESAVYDAVIAHAPATVGGLVRYETRVEPLHVEANEPARCLWMATVRYARTEHGPGSQPPSQVFGDGSYTFDTTGGNQQITQSRKTVSATKAVGDDRDVPVFGAAPGISGGGGIGFNGEDFDGVDIAVPVYNFTETHQFTDEQMTLAYRGTLFGLTGKVNNAAFKGLAAGECLYLGASGSKRGSSWEITFNFAAQPNASNLQVGNIVVAAKAGWEYLWVLYEDVADAAADMIVRRPRAAYVEEVYESADFAGLGIGV